MRFVPVFCSVALALVACDSDTPSGSSDDATTQPDIDATGNDATNVDAPPVSEVPPVTAGFPDFGGSTNEAMLTAVAGSYEVVVFRAPAGKESDIGRATLDITFDGDAVGIILTTRGGVVINDVSNSLTHSSAGGVMVQPFINYLIVDQNSSALRRTAVTFYTNGVVEGTVGMDAGYGFRNGILHWGATPPPRLGEFAGTWSGDHEAAVCRAPVTVVIGADRVSVSGVAQPGCPSTPETITAIWDGNDDYVITNPELTTLTQITIDSQKGGGSQPQGGVWVYYDATHIEQISTTLASAAGNIVVKNPAKQ